MSKPHAQTEWYSYASIIRPSFRPKKKHQGNVNQEYNNNIM